MLSDRRAVERSESKPRDRIGVSATLHHEDKTRAVQCARAILADGTVGADPELLPLLQQRIVGVEALSLSAVLAGPILEQSAASTHRLDDARPNRGARFGSHVPFTDPEIEAMALGLAGALARQRGRGA